jgi:hypothetical protein
MQPVEMRFLGTLRGCTRLDHFRNEDIRKTENTVTVN